MVIPFGASTIVFSESQVGHSGGEVASTNSQSRILIMWGIGNLVGVPKGTLPEGVAAGVDIVTSVTEGVAAGEVPTGSSMVGAGSLSEGRVVTVLGGISDTLGVSGIHEEQETSTQANKIIRIRLAMK
jgi:hypothetical protein